MNGLPRKKSPRAPSTSLEEAIGRAIKVYDKDRLHPAPTEVFANNLGYKTANNGAALTMVASLRYFGLVERRGDGILAISKDVESYKFAPEATLRDELLRKFLRSPPLYAELLDKYASGLPSDANLRYELIQRGFAPAAAESALKCFKESVAFVGHFGSGGQTVESSVQDQGAVQPVSSPADPTPVAHGGSTYLPAVSAKARASSPPDDFDSEADKIPVRLPGGRKAWLAIPSPFYEADKLRLKAQIDLLLTNDEDDEG